MKDVVLGNVVLDTSGWDVLTVDARRLVEKPRRGLAMATAMSTANTFQQGTPRRLRPHAPNTQ